MRCIVKHIIALVKVKASGLFIETARSSKCLANKSRKMYATDYTCVICEFFGVLHT
jgi:hypothetical protein